MVSHNIIVVHAQLIKFPDIAFFVSPIPIHIAAMVILFGQMSACDNLPREIAVQDVWTALDMLPRFRWHWERRDMGGAHPLIEKVAEKVLYIEMSQVKQSMGPQMLIPEEDWESGSPLLSPTPSNNQLTSPTNNHSPFNAQGHYGAQAANGAGESSGKQLADIPPNWFWPMDPQNPIGMPMPGVQMGQQSPNQPTVQGQPQYYQPIGTIGCEPSRQSYIVEEKDPSFTRAQAQQWVNSAVRNIRLPS